MIWHIQPIDDLEEHEESSMCKCKPKVKEYNGDLFVIHKSYDGREIAEQLIEEMKKPDE